nr:hypothetical protein [Azospirillum oleiclasticum]
MLTPMTTPALPPAVLVHGLDDALAAVSAAAETGRAVALLSAPAASAHAGALWLLELRSRALDAHPSADAIAILDCDDRAGDAQGAIAAGVTRLVFSGRADAAARLADIAAACGAVLLTARPAALDLRGRRDAAAACRAWLLGRTG